MFVVRNYTEVMVDNLLDSILKKSPDVCCCERCRADIKALALNNLPSRYIVTHKGEIYKKLEELNGQFRADITLAITKALIIVSTNPYH